MKIIFSIGEDLVLLLTYTHYSEGNLFFHKLDLQKNHRCNLFHLPSSVKLCRFYNASVFQSYT